MSNRSLTAYAFLVLALGSACGGDPTEPVVDNTIASLSISGVSKVKPGSTVQLVAKAKNAAGTEVPVSGVVWSSSAQSIATVSANGLVSGLANGSAEISATAAGVTGKMMISVETSSPSTNAVVQVAPGGYLEFSPSVVDVNVGGEVSWTFTLEVYTNHNVTFDAATGAPEHIGNTPSGTVSRTFTTAGTFNYRCTNHPGMSGSVVVH